MPLNIEIKARAADWNAQFAKAKSLCDSQEELAQEDTFFNCPNGRLKLRDLGPGKESYLIFYKRDNQAGPKSSQYDVSPVPDVPSMKALLAKAYGQGKIIRKKRTVLMVGQTRVHFDDVEGLGRFIELEVCMKPGQSRQEGETIAEALMSELRIGRPDLLEGAYAEMAPR